MVDERDKMEPYTARFSKGQIVAIQSKGILESFLHTWSYHTPLSLEQLEYASRHARVQNIGFYHGGDPLYILENVPGVWHESCLKLSDELVQENE